MDVTSRTVRFISTNINIDVFESIRVRLSVPGLVSWFVHNQSSLPEPIPVLNFHVLTIASHEYVTGLGPKCVRGLHGCAFGNSERTLNQPRSHAATPSGTALSTIASVRVPGLIERREPCSLHVAMGNPVYKIELW